MEPILPVFPRLYPAERLAGWLTLAVIALDALLLGYRGSRIDWSAFAGNGMVALLLGTMALGYRALGRSANIATTLLACAVFILFSNAGVILNNLALGPGNNPIDPFLFRIDAALGFDWKAMAIAMADFPHVSRALGWVYDSSLMQLSAVMIWLGFAGERTQLHRFVLVGIVACCLTMGFWSMAPSFGPSPYITLPPEIDVRLGRVVDASLGRQLAAMAAHGAPQVIGREQLIGLIAFPSMHTVMALMAVWFSRGTRLFAPLALVNLAMIPAILLHGGHHLIDVIGGLGLFALVALLVARLVPEVAAIEHEAEPTPAGALNPA